MPRTEDNSSAAGAASFKPTAAEKRAKIAAEISASTKPWLVFYGANVCRVHADPGREGVGDNNAISVNFDRSPEGVAKALLIASAPATAEAASAMLAALETLAGWVDAQRKLGTIPNVDFPAAKDAIAAAKAAGIKVEG